MRWKAYPEESRLLVVFLITSSLVLLYGLFQFNRQPFDLALLKSLQPGMSKSEVVKILGSPRSEFDSSWHYARVGAWPILHVDFDNQDRLVSFESDE